MHAKNKESQGAQSSIMQIRAPGQFASETMSSVLDSGRNSLAEQRGTSKFQVNCQTLGGTRSDEFTSEPLTNEYSSQPVNRRLEGGVIGHLLSHGSATTSNKDLEDVKKRIERLMQSGIQSERSESIVEYSQKR